MRVCEWGACYVCTNLCVRQILSEQAVLYVTGSDAGAVWEDVRAVRAFAAAATSK